MPASTETQARLPALPEKKAGCEPAVRQIEVYYSGGPEQPSPCRAGIFVLIIG